MERVFILTREEHGRTAVLLVCREQNMASSMMSSHVKFRVEQEGAFFLVSRVEHPAPVAEGAQVRCGGSEGQPELQPAPPFIECCVEETIIIASGERAVYRIVQHAVR